MYCSLHHGFIDDDLQCALNTMRETHHPSVFPPAPVQLEKTLTEQCPVASLATDDLRFVMEAYGHAEVIARSTQRCANWYYVGASVASNFQRKLCVLCPQTFSLCKHSREEGGQKIKADHHVVREHYITDHDGTTKVAAVRAARLAAANACYRPVEEGTWPDGRQLRPSHGSASVTSPRQCKRNRQNSTNAQSAATQVTPAVHGASGM